MNCLSRRPWSDGAVHSPPSPPPLLLHHHPTRHGFMGLVGRVWWGWGRGWYPPDAPRTLVFGRGQVHGSASHGCMGVSTAMAWLCARAPPQFLAFFNGRRSQLFSWSRGPNERALLCFFFSFLHLAVPPSVLLCYAMQCVLCVSETAPATFDFSWGLRLKELAYLLPRLADGDVLTWKYCCTVMGGVRCVSVPVGRGGAPDFIPS